MLANRVTMPKVVIKTQSSTKLETNLKECQIDEKKNCKMFHKICYHYSPYYCLFVIISIISIYLVVSGVHERVGQGRVTEFAKYLRNFLGIFSKQDIDECYHCRTHRVPTYPWYFQVLGR